MKKRAYSFWKKIDMLLLESGVIPPGKSLNACKVFCCRHKIKFPGQGDIQGESRTPRTAGEEEWEVIGTASRGCPRKTPW